MVLSIHLCSIVVYHMNSRKKTVKTEVLSRPFLFVRLFLTCMNRRYLLLVSSTPDKPKLRLKPLGKVYKNAIFVLSSLEDTGGYSNLFVLRKIVFTVFQVNYCLCLTQQSQKMDDMAHTVHIYLKNLQKQLFCNLIITKIFYICTGDTWPHNLLLDIYLNW